MQEVNNKNFSLAIAFWLPGFVLLWGLSYSVDEVRTLLAQPRTDAPPSVGGFLYVTVASLAVGLFLSAIRWATVEKFLYATGLVKKIDLNFSELGNKDTALAFYNVHENHYRHYLYYSNTLVAVIIAFASHIFFVKDSSCFLWISTLGVIVILLLASRDCLNNYYSRGNQILGNLTEVTDGQRNATRRSPQSHKKARAQGRKKEVRSQDEAESQEVANIR